MRPENIEVLIGASELQDRVRDMGQQISRDFVGRNPILLGVLKGAFVFMADLIRQVDIPMSVEFMAISSYGSEKRSSGEVKVVKDVDVPIEGREVLIVEDIIDTGLTLSYLINTLHNRGAANIRLAALLDKHECRVRDVKIDYVGFKIPNVFVVGYGLDYAEEYRNLPYVGVLISSQSIEETGPGC